VRERGVVEEFSISIGFIFTFHVKYMQKVMLRRPTASLGYSLCIILTHNLVSVTVKVVIQ
jgi:hypothetical protein